MQHVCFALEATHTTDGRTEDRNEGREKKKEAATIALCASKQVREEAKLPVPAAE